METRYVEARYVEARYVEARYVEACYVEARYVGAYYRESNRFKPTVSRHQARFLSAQWSTSNRCGKEDDKSTGKVAACLVPRCICKIFV